MKNPLMSLLLLFIAIIIAQTLTAQITDIAVFPTDNARWKELVIFDYEIPDESIQLSPVIINYTVLGDTIIDDIKRGKLYFSLLDEQNLELIGYMHVHENKVYFRARDNVYLPDKYILLCIDESEKQHDILLYDFTFETNADYFDCHESYVLSDVNTAYLGEAERKQYVFSSLIYPYTKKYWIEGMGSTLNLFDPVSLPVADLYFKTLICFSQNNEVLWVNPNYPSILANDKQEINSSLIRICQNPVSASSLLISSLPMQKIQIYDVNGILVLDKNMHGCLQYNIEQHLLGSGIYFANIILENNVSAKIKIILK
jgi:hypothetical protein